MRENTGIALTESAVKRIQHVIEKSDHGKGIRVRVKKTGCSGYGCVIDLADAPEPNDEVFEDASGIFVCIDPKSYDFVKGSTIDCVREGLSERLVFHNPNQTGECGCGESFTVD